MVEVPFMKYLPTKYFQSYISDTVGKIDFRFRLSFFIRIYLLYLFSYICEICHLWWIMNSWNSWTLTDFILRIPKTAMSYPLRKLGLIQVNHEELKQSVEFIRRRGLGIRQLSEYWVDGLVFAAEGWRICKVKIGRATNSVGPHKGLVVVVVKDEINVSCCDGSINFEIRGRWLVVERAAANHHHLADL